MPNDDDADGAIRAGVAFLGRTQMTSGNFPLSRWTTPGVRDLVPDSSVFAVALIAEALADVAGTGEIVGKAADLLEGEMDRRGLWRHWTRDSPKHLIPPFDLDDTACASLALRRAGRRVPDNRRTILRNRDARGLFYSWKITPELWLHPLRLRWFFTVTSSRPRDVDAVVNANVLCYLGLDRQTAAVVPYLAAILARGGEADCDKWYVDPFVIWFFFSRALAHHRPDLAPLVLDRLAGARPASALQHALSITTALLWTQLPDPGAVTALLDAQAPDGSWPIAPFYCGADRRWGSQQLTTAYCIRALSRWREARA